MENTETVRTIFCQDTGIYYLHEADKRHRPNVNDISYEFPGGKIEPGQNHPDAILTETREEVGVDLNDFFTNAEIASFYAATIKRLQTNFETGEDTEYFIIAHVYLINVSRAFAAQFKAVGLPEDRLTGNSIWIPKKGLIELANKKPINSITGTDLERIL
jgi:8-oxo-dGTP pyrophosphatase MutT (NUDIX family)